jgi:hypothetical protein
MSDEPIFCDRCASELTPGAGDWYQVWIHAVADPHAPVIERSRTVEEIRREIERLVAQLSEVSAQEALDQVHRRLTLYLCQRCFTAWIENPTGS